MSNNKKIILGFALSILILVVLFLIFGKDEKIQIELEIPAPENVEYVPDYEILDGGKQM